jgi:hypothetical protein
MTRCSWYTNTYSTVTLTEQRLHQGRAHKRNKQPSHSAILSKVQFGRHNLTECTWMSKSWVAQVGRLRC